MEAPGFTMSRHAATRSVQRSIPEAGVELLLRFGTRRRAKDGAWSVSFTEKDWKNLKRFFGSWMPNKAGQLRKVYAVLDDHDHIITAAYASDT